VNSSPRPFSSHTITPCSFAVLLWSSSILQSTSLSSNLAFPTLAGDLLFRRRRQPLRRHLGLSWRSTFPTTSILTNVLNRTALLPLSSYPTSGPPPVCRHAGTPSPWLSSIAATSVHRRSTPSGQPRPSHHPQLGPRKPPGPPWPVSPRRRRSPSPEFGQQFSASFPDCVDLNLPEGLAARFQSLPSIQNQWSLEICRNL
jgi:hypothetical protein